MNNLHIFRTVGLPAIAMLRWIRTKKEQYSQGDRLDGVSQMRILLTQVRQEMSLNEKQTSALKLFGSIMLPVLWVRRRDNNSVRDSPFQCSLRGMTVLRITQLKVSFRTNLGLVNGTEGIAVDVVTDRKSIVVPFSGSGAMKEQTGRPKQQQRYQDTVLR
jgi:hypothetical protein